MKCENCNDDKYVWVTCSVCNGSGEANYDWSICNECKGDGVILERCTECGDDE